MCYYLKFLDSLFDVPAEQILLISHFYSAAEVDLAPFQKMSLKEFKETINSPSIIRTLLTSLNTGAFELVKKLVEKKRIDSLTKARIKKLCDQRIKEFSPHIKGYYTQFFNNELDKVTITRGRTKASIARDLCDLLVKEESCKR